MQRQPRDPVPGYLGAIAVASVINILELLDINILELPDIGNPLILLIAVYLVPALRALCLNFDPSEILTPLGRERFELCSWI